MKNEDAERTTNLVRIARKLLASGGTLESGAPSGSLGEEQVLAALKNQILSRADILSEGGRDLTANVAADEVLAVAKSALTKTAAGAETSDLTGSEFAGLEAIIRLTGRPAMGYKGGQVETPSGIGENEHWQVFLALARAKINTASASIGRVELTGLGDVVLLGTAWRLGDDLVVTNRHVARLLAANSTGPVSSWKLETTKGPRVDFGIASVGGVPRMFSVTGISYCAPEPEVDLAILKLQCNSIAAPPPLAVDMLPTSLGYEVTNTSAEGVGFKGGEIYVVGHPAGPSNSEAISSVFGKADGSKRWSPGFVTRVESRYPVFEHDCSTLGGNSGSCVLTSASHTVVGVHFGGRGVEPLTGVGRTNAALALSRIVDNKAGTILKTGKI